LAGNFCDQVEVGVVVEHRQSLDLGGGSDEQVRDAYSPMLAALDQCGLDLAGAIFGAECGLEAVDRGSSDECRGNGQWT
jgi:hypothetical protein